MDTHHLNAATLAVGFAALVGSISGCQSGGTAGTRSGSVPVRLDGAIDEWPVDAACVGDADYVYVRLSVENEQFTLQHSPKTLAVYLDLDCNPESGVRADAPTQSARGADLIIEFSPRTGGPEAGQGVGVSGVDASGTRRVVRHADLDVAFAPTYAAPWYELRLSRHPAPASALSPTLTAADGVVRGVVVLFDQNGAVEGQSEAFEATLPPLGTGSLRGPDIPARGQGTLRVVSWNVQKSAPVEHPDAFARVLKALDPDVVLLQEWDKSDAAALQGWFTAFVPSGSGWHAMKSPDGDVAVVSRYPLEGVGAKAPGIAGEDKPVRFISAKTATPGGELLIASMHLKCCGYKDSAEDTRRIAEARAINESLRSTKGLPGWRVIGGDLNLVGSRPPLDLLRAGLDCDGSDLAVADPMVLGDSTFSTWSDSASEFTPGRLDYLLWTDSCARIVHEFVLDTSRLPASVLARAGLRADDTRASDHLPVVMDIAPVAMSASVGDEGIGESRN